MGVRHGVFCMLVLAGCATTDEHDTLQRLRAHAQLTPDAPVALVRGQAQQQANAVHVDALLAQPLSQEAAVRLMLLNSPQFQTLLAEGLENAAHAAQAGRVSNPRFNWERSVFQSEVEVGRLLTVGLFDLISLPWRTDIAQQEVERARLQMAQRVVEQTHTVRQAWVEALAAQQKLRYANQVLDSAKASAELAKRMQEAGNFTRLEHAKQHSFYTEAVVNMTLAKHQNKAAHEALVRALGLTMEHAAQLRLPDRLPDLPLTPKQAQEFGTHATSRLDLQLAKLSYDRAMQAQGLSRVSQFVDVDLGVRRDTVFQNNGAPSARKRGYELEIDLPIFDWGGLQREAMQAATLVAANRLEATLREAESSVRAHYSAYQANYDMARYYQEEVLPLKQRIAEENLLRYNGMQLGVFDLLAESREHVHAVMQALDAQADFWRADARLQAVLMGALN